MLKSEPAPPQTKDEIAVTQKDLEFSSKIKDQNNGDILAIQGDG